MQLATLTQCAISMMSLYFGERNFAVYKPPHHLSLVGTTLKRLRRYCTVTIHRTSSTSPSKPVCGLVLPDDPMNLLLRYRHQFIVNWFRSPFIICLFNFIAKYNLFQKTNSRLPIFSVKRKNCPVPRFLTFTLARSVIELRLKKFRQWVTLARSVFDLRMKTC